MNPLLFIRVVWSSLFPPKRRVVRLVRPHWHTTDFAVLECGHRAPLLDYDEIVQGRARCTRCLR